MSNASRIVLAGVGVSVSAVLMAQLPPLPTIPPDPAAGAAAPGLPAAPTPQPVVSSTPAPSALPSASAPGLAEGLPSLPGMVDLTGAPPQPAAGAGSAGAVPASTSSALPPPQQQLPGDRIPQEDIARIQRRKETEDALAQIREALYRQDFDAMKMAIEQAERVDPNSPQLQVYKGMLARKIAEAETSQKSAVRTPRAGTAGLGMVPGEVPGLGSTLTSPTPSTAVAGSTPVPQFQPANERSMEAAAPPERMSRGKRKLIAIGIAVGLTLLWALGKLIFAKIASRRSVPAPASAPVRRTPAASPELLFQSTEDSYGVPPPPPPPPPGAPGALASAPMYPAMEADVVEEPEDQQALARNIAQNLATMKTAPAGSANFNLFGTQNADANEGGSAFMDSAPTIAESPTMIDNMPTIMENSPTMVEGDVNSVDPALFAAPPRIESPKKPEEPKKAAAPPPEPVSTSDTVSFEDLGIFMNEPPAEVTTPAPPANPAAENLALSEGVPPTASDKPIAAPKPTVAGSGGAIRLDDLTVTSNNERPAPEVPSKPVAGGIDLQGLFANIPSQPKPEADPPAATPSSPADALKLPVRSDSDDAAEKTYGAYADTFHSQDTIALTNSGLGMPTANQGSPKREFSSPEDLVPHLGTDDNDLAITKTAANPAAGAGQESVYAASPGKGAQLDERSEKMFREQYDRATKALNEKNWRQAVHYLSIAAAIHPENEKVREQLKEARAEKRKQEAGV